jgi:hypothetical protein
VNATTGCAVTAGQLNVGPNLFFVYGEQVGSNNNVPALDEPWSLGQVWQTDLAG